MSRAMNGADTTADRLASGVGDDSDSAAVESAASDAAADQPSPANAARPDDNVPPDEGAAG